ncbi:MAG: hypothetical protein LLG00_05040 [Planctomycetaceae bacterium]|nr:hypothetical protein [Planctomycetaceae bacterium]
MSLHQDAKKIAWHVAYEVWMFSASVDALNETRQNGSRATRNAHLEAILLHARVIHEFMFTKVNPKYPDDVRAANFLDDPAGWPPDQTKLCPFLATNLERLNRSLHHISFDRLKFRRNLWDYETVASEIRAVWKYFLTSLPADRKRWLELALEAQTSHNEQWYLSAVT